MLIAPDQAFPRIRRGSPSALLPSGPTAVRQAVEGDDTFLTGDRDLRPDPASPIAPSGCRRHRFDQGTPPSSTKDSIAMSGSMWFALRKASTLRPMTRSIPTTSSSRIVC